MLVRLPLSELTELIIAKGIAVHDHFGPGLFETVYKRCLGLLLVEAGLIVEMEKPVPVTFRNLSLDCGYRLDLVVENKVVVEVKAVDALALIHRTQLRTYLRLAECPVGLILNVNVPLLKQGIRRVVNKRCLTPEELKMLEATQQESERRDESESADTNIHDEQSQPPRLPELPQRDFW
jgi:GxxExxY protein